MKHSLYWEYSLSDLSHFQVIKTTADKPLEAPEQTGFLDDEEMQDIWTIFSFIGQQWDNGNVCILNTEQKFKPIIDQKTSQVPSYLTEYRNAIQQFRTLQNEYGEQEALQILFLETPSSSSIRIYVLHEFLKLQIANGGFRGFNSSYLNYLGWMKGGIFSDPEHPAYRGLDYIC